MRKKWLVVMGLITTVIIIGGLLFLQLKKVKATQLEDVLIKTVQAFSSEQIDFNGQLTTDSPYPITSDFQTVISKNTSKTSAYVALLGDTKNSVNIEVISSDGKSYLKILNATDVVEKLEDNPLSRAIAVNIQPLITQYQNKWIELDETTDVSRAIQCWKPIFSYDTKEELLRSSFKKNSFLTLVSTNKTTIDGSQTVRYELVPNDQMDNFINTVFGESQNVDECNISFSNNEKIFISINEEGNLKEIQLKNNTMTIVLKPTTNSSQAIIERPQTKLKFSSLKQQIDSLFLK